LVLQLLRGSKSIEHTRETLHENGAFERTVTVNPGVVIAKPKRAANLRCPTRSTSFSAAVKSIQVPYRFSNYSGSDWQETPDLTLLPWYLTSDA
jgi:hypothetical protein